MSVQDVQAWFSKHMMTIFVCILIIVIVVLGVVLYFQRGTSQSESSRPPEHGASRAVSASMIREAAQHAEDAENAVKTARTAVDKARIGVGNAGPENKDAAVGALTKANKDLAAAESALQHEEKVLDVLTHGQSPFLGPGSLQYLVFGFLALIVLAFLMYGMINGALLTSLASIPTSRGLITFLIAVVTVAIGLILVLATVVSENDDLSRRLTLGKEVLTMLIGVLGTIVGFYFGSATDGTRSLQISPPSVLNESLVGGSDTVDLRSFISGGKASYTVDVEFDPPNVVGPVTTLQSPDGTISLTGIKTQKVDKATKVSYKIKAKDSEGRTGLYDSAAAGKYLEVKPGQGS